MNEINGSVDAWLIANYPYLVVIVISVTRVDVLLSCEIAVGKDAFVESCDHISALFVLRMHSVNSLIIFT